MQKARTTPYHPQLNGVVDRGNQTLDDSLRCLLQESGKRQGEWDLLLLHIMKLFKATPNATGESANYIMLGGEVKLPVLLAFWQ